MSYYKGLWEAEAEDAEQQPRFYRRVISVILTLAFVWVICEVWRYGLAEQLLKYALAIARVGGIG